MSTTTHHDDDDEIPIDIQTEIIKRIPDVKTLIGFRSVSKPWKSSIDGSKLIADYKSNNHHILLSYEIRGYIYLISIVDDYKDDDYNFIPQIRKFPPVALADSSVNPTLIGTSQGLFCFFYGKKVKKSYSGKIVFFNPSIRKSVTIHVPTDMLPSAIAIGFGVCPRTNDPKLFVIKKTTNTSLGAEIFTLSSGAWRSLSISLPNICDTTSFLFSKDDDNRDYHTVAIDGILYCHITTKGGNGRWYNRVVTFDLTSEEFGEVCLPDKLATRPKHKLSISNLRECLVVLEYYREGLNRDCFVWIVMERGASKSFERLFIIKKPFFYIVKGFKMNDRPIIETKNKKEGVLQVYDFCARQIIDHDLNHLMIDGHVSFKGCYTETLLLLNQSDSGIHW